MVASTGGHLRQLVELRARLPGVEETVWFTFATTQSRSLLAGEDVVYGRYARPRDVPATIANARIARRLLKERAFTRVISTGASIAIAAMPLARARSIPCHYIESATRVTGPSLTGRMLQYVPGVELYTQYRSWENERWRYGGSIFDGFASDPAAGAPLRRILVSLGTIEDYEFRPLLERMVAIAPDGVEIVWQTGSTDARGLGIESRSSIPATEFDQLLSDVDVVVSHAGTGSAVAAMHAGRFPILVPRRAARSEHVDDHQFQIARELESRGLALHREVDQLTVDDLCTAAATRIVVRDHPAPFELRSDS